MKKCKERQGGKLSRGGGGAAVQLLSLSVHCEENCEEDDTSECRSALVKSQRLGAVLTNRCSTVGGEGLVVNTGADRWGGGHGKTWV